MSADEAMLGRQYRECYAQPGRQMMPTIAWIYDRISGLSGTGIGRSRSKSHVANYRPIAGHGDEVPEANQRLDDLQLLGRFDRGEHARLSNERVDGLAPLCHHLLGHGTRHDLLGPVGEAELTRDGERRDRIISGDHRHRDARGTAGFSAVASLG